MTIKLGDAYCLCPLSPKTEQVIQKVWGAEYILPCEGYTTKIMEAKPGFQSSLHFHGKKSETFILVQGQLDIELYEPDGTKHTAAMSSPLDSAVLPACTPHTFSVPESQEFNTIFIESSTVDDPADSYRITKSKMNAQHDSSDRRPNN